MSFSCILCGAQFKAKGNAFRHFRDKHKAKSTNESCNLCGKQFKLFRQKVDHYRTVHGISARQMKLNHPFNFN